MKMEQALQKAKGLVELLEAQAREAKLSSGIKKRNARIAEAKRVQAEAVKMLVNELESRLATEKDEREYGDDLDPFDR